ncbi:LysE family translocator [Sessilibacter corallicola]|uniref:LysE family translocator n=1 Tax=Sessilibacter corallicola TaxID=2904075 RepID=UPI001E47D23A|nr:LysE family translocator [Sessilibacter corallicola]MCE2027700.1 LysE family translocator [Sessilibacter corallicola]
MIEVSQLLAYVVALGIAAAIPGPGMTALVARSAASGATAGFVMLAGLILGDLTYLSLAVFGLAVVAKTFSEFFIVVKLLAAAYLVYLAWRFWVAEHQSINANANISKKELVGTFISGLTITLSNPKTIAFYLALLPVVINLQDVTVLNWATALVPATVGILLVIGGAFIFGALIIRKFLASAKAQKYLHRGAATAMIAAAGTMVVKGS